MKTKSKDNLHRYLVLDKQARLITVFSTDAVNEYAKNIKCTPLATAAMGRLITATLMLGSMLKGNEKVSLSIDGHGPIGRITGEADSMGHVCAHAQNPLVDLPLKDNGMFDVASAVGSDGFLQVRKQLFMKEPFVGSCELVSGEIGEDLSYYFGTSEQTDTVVALGVLVNPDGTCMQAGGFLLQLLPNAKQEAKDYLSNLLTKIKSVSELLTKAKTSDQLVYQLFSDADLLFEYEVSYKCSCSIEKTKLMLTQLSNEDLDEEIAKGTGIDVTCNFCLKKYHVTCEELKEVKKLKNKVGYIIK